MDNRQRPDPSLPLHAFHLARGARLTTVNGRQVVLDYGEPLREHRALWQSAGLLDLSFRGRLCVLGPDRQAFVNGQVTNNVGDLKAGEGCYAALVSAKGKLQSDLYVFCLPEEILLDFEPGWSKPVSQRLEKYVVSERVEIADAAPMYGLWRVQGPRAAQALSDLALPVSIPPKAMSATSGQDPRWGEICVVRRGSIESPAFDLFLPQAAMAEIGERCQEAVARVEGRLCGWQAMEWLRLEGGVPRFGADMDPTHFPQEAGIEAAAVSYSKGCYIGQEIIARIRTYGRLKRKLQGLRLPDDLPELPPHGTKLYSEAKPAGSLTSVFRSPRLKANLALGYVSQEIPPNSPLALRWMGRDWPVQVTPLPFVSTAMPEDRAAGKS